MQRKLAVLAVTVAATFGTLALGLAGTAAADPGYYQVYGTDGYGLNVHIVPSVSSPVVGTLSEGDSVYIACQVYSDPVTNPVTGATSQVWDVMVDPNTFTSTYVSDLYVDTPGYGIITLGTCG
jgi:hypothetical protein